MQNVKINNAVIFDAYCELDNIKGILSLIDFAITSNENGAYKRNTTLSIELYYVNQMVNDIFPIIKSHAESASEMAPIEDLIKVNKIFSLIDHKFAFDVTQDSIGNVSDYVTKLDEHIANSLYGAQTLIYGMRDKIESITVLDKEAA